MKKKITAPVIGFLFTALLNPKSMHQVFSFSWDLKQYINVLCVILFCQCDFTQLWGNQPTKIGRKALCIRIKINKFQKQYIQWVKLQILSQLVCFSKIKKRERKKTEKKTKQNSKLTLKSTKQSGGYLLSKALLCKISTRTITFSHTHF